ncbi:hypothetical protein PLICRDRAFT_110490 [Plicaturopsis crispa FD-325 SS-3]|nr:hypothetical protein PLICRDRAFT_110490 [Plicaturopsis crispa FD-325 SS-3]
MQQPYASLGSIQTSETDTKPVTSSNETPAESKIGGWAIWSRRPHNPSHAPGIIISPLARPPQIVIDGALEQHTPPPSPKPVVEVQNVAVLKESTPEHTDLPSSSATETTTASSTAPDTPVQGSPLSTNTSVSAVADSSDKSKKSSLSPKVETVQVETIQPPVPKPAPVKKSWASLLRPTDSVASSSKSALPTSSVVGFSIPGVSTQGGVAASSPGRKSELLALLMSAPSGPLGGPPRIQPRGLVNSGNMCFANAVLQVLVYCPQFYRLFTDLGKYLTGPVVGAQAEKGTPLVDATIDFLKEFTPATPPPSDKANGTSKTKGKEVARDDEGGDLDSFIPTNIYEALKEKKRFDSMRGGHQEDAEEFLGFFLDTLEEELLSIANSLNDAENKPDPAVEEHEEAAPPEEDGWLEVGRRNRTVITRTIKSAESPITKIFGGKSRSTLRAPGQKDSVTIEDWRSLRLDIQREQVHTIKDALQYISHPQPVQMTHPSKPGVTIDASQQILIDALPPILILHMKRFLYDTSVRDVVKVGKQVSFTPELDIPSDLMSPTRKLHTTRYKLFGVLYHHGLSASGGHYTLDVLHPNRDLSNKPREAWIRIDDELVSDVRPDDVFGGLDRDDRCAYLLFYRRVGAPRT